MYVTNAEECICARYTHLHVHPWYYYVSVQGYSLMDDRDEFMPSAHMREL